MPLLWPRGHARHRAVTLPAASWGRGRRILIPPCFNHPRWPGDSPVLPTTKKLHLEMSLRLHPQPSAALVRREPHDPPRDAMLQPSTPSSPAFCWVCEPVVSWLPSSWSAVAQRARRRAWPVLLTPGSPSACNLWRCWWEQGEGWELSGG